MGIVGKIVRYQIRGLLKYLIKHSSTLKFYLHQKNKKEKEKDMIDVSVGGLYNSIYSSVYLIVCIS